MKPDTGAECNPKLILASGSPRRRELLDLIGIEHIVCVSDVDETPLPGESAEVYAVRAAADKARAVARTHGEAPVLGSDTVVEIDDEILGKPRDDADACHMLERLSGQVHHVHTSVALVAAGRCETLLDSTAVRFRTLRPEVIPWYVNTGEPMDKAGAYAIQGIGGLLVEGIDGSPHTVIGLPIHRLPELFLRFDLNLWEMLRDL